METSTRETNPVHHFHQTLKKVIRQLPFTRVFPFASQAHRQTQQAVLEWDPSSTPYKTSFHHSIKGPLPE